MANGVQKQEGVPENLKKQLAVAVRSVQWSYAIFWSLSTRQLGVLEWSDGYYNGDIKTRKTVQAIECKADEMGLLRSGQLRELYESLLEGETDQQAKRPSATLSPEDLTDEEWYYLVCMGFVFNPDQGLPGRALSNGKPIWLCNAHSADSKVFSRSLLAKSASIQTVVCFPHFGGVIELGVTELVLEDPGFIQHIKASLLELSKPMCSEKPSSSPDNPDDDKDCTFAKVDHEIEDTMDLGHEIVDTRALENIYSPAEDIEFDHEGFNELDGNICEDFFMDSPDETDSVLEGIDGGASQVQSSDFMDDDFSNCVQGSMNSSDHISQAFVNQEKAISPPKDEDVKNLHLKELHECNHTKLSSMDLGTNDDLHYIRTVSSILKHSHRLTENPCFQSCDHKSSFSNWKKGVMVEGHRSGVQQRMLKKILFDVPLMHGSCSLKPPEENGGKNWLWKPESGEICVQPALPDKRAENDKFLVLKSMVPSIIKIDKVSILDGTIEYLQKLESRVGELKSCIDPAVTEARAMRKYPDMVEQTSDNYNDRGIDNGTKPWINKRKACDIDETEPELNSEVPKDGLPLDMKVSINEQKVQIKIRCPWKEYLLLDIIDAINNLNLDVHSVQSSTLDGILTLILQSQVQGPTVASARVIKQALRKIAGKPRDA